MYRATRFDALCNEALQTLSRGVGHAPQADATDLAPIFLCGNHDQGLAAMFPPLPTFFLSSPVHLIHFHASSKPIPIRPHHRPPQLVQPRPSRLVAAKTQHSLEPQGTGAVLLRGHPPDRSKPHRQGLVGILKDGAGCDGYLMPARGAFQPHLRYRPSLGVVTARTPETFRPTQSAEILSASLVGSKPPLEFSQIPGKLFHGPKHYPWG